MCAVACFNVSGAIPPIVRALLHLASIVEFIRFSVTFASLLSEHSVWEQNSTNGS